MPRKLFEPLLALGETAIAGEPLARIWPTENLRAEPSEILAVRDGLVAARHVPGLIKPGDCAFVLGTDQGPI